MSRSWEASAPSNIALIKYMGKTDVSSNTASNSSLSYTLEHLKSFVELTESKSDGWEPFESHPIQLSDAGQERYLRHLQRIKSAYGFTGAFRVRSYNDFPSDCGLASSASSFAALTKVTCQAIADLTGREISVDEMSSLSRQGSGSSCRSFFSPWSIWRGESAIQVEGLGSDSLIHYVAVVDEAVKKVSSSEAHKRVSGSEMFVGRTERAESRLESLMAALRGGQWERAYQICWSEFWDMHALFETAEVPFGYMSPLSLEVLRSCRELWESEGDGPLVTMDAGPNVHLLFRQDQSEMADRFTRESKFHWIGQ